jgi:hypothetical protein
VFAVYLATGGTVAEQTAFLAEGGFAPNRDATCPVRLDDEVALDAGISKYQRLTFPVARTVLPDGGIDIQLPPVPQGVRAGIDVMDWEDCTLVASTAPVAALWGSSRPFQTVAAAAKPWCRQGPGKPCLLLDGGTFGDRNVSGCSMRATPAVDCERIGVGRIYAGDDPETIQ